MTKEELKQEAEKWLRKFLLCNDCKRKCHCIELNAYCEEQVLKAYIDSAEPREKRIAELEEDNAELKEIINNDVDKKIYVQLAMKANLADVQKEQITKARVCLEQLVSEITVGELEVDPNVLQQAENFLNDLEKVK